MSNVRKLIERFKSLDIDHVSEQSIENTKDVMVELNKKQLYSGEAADGSPLASFNRSVYYNDDYADLKNDMNPLPGYGNKDHYLTGDYYRGIHATIQGGVIKIESSDDKAGKLEKKGDYGLNNENKAAYIKEHLQPEFISIISEKLGLPYG